MSILQYGFYEPIWTHRTCKRLGEHGMILGTPIVDVIPSFDRLLLRSETPRWYLMSGTPL